MKVNQIILVEAIYLMVKKWKSGIIIIIIIITIAIIYKLALL